MAPPCDPAELTVFRIPMRGYEAIFAAEPNRPPPVPNPHEGL